MKRSIIRCAVSLASSLLLFSGTHAAELDVTSTVPGIFAPAGSSVVLDAVIANPTLNVVYLTGVSSDVPEAFAGSNLFDEFLSVAPDSLLPGESWEGPVIRLTVAPTAPIDSTHLVGVVFSGGDHPYDNQTLSNFAFAINDSGAVTGVPRVTAMPVSLILRASPNPMHRSAEIAFELASPADVDVQVYDVSGRVIRTLAHGFKAAGPYRLAWDSRDNGGDVVHPGIYFVRLRTQEGVRKTKVVRID